MSKRPEVPFQTTLRVRDHCLCLHTQRAARALARLFDEAFRPLEITSGQFSLMMALNRPEPPAMAAVAALLGMDRTTLTAALKPLERRGLVEAKASSRDKRARLLTLTAPGLALLAAAAPIWERTHAAAETLAGADPDQLRSALRSISCAAPGDASVP
jgi:DNA-binding MarR family transcriptional regulator